VAGSRQLPQEPSMSSRRPDPGLAGQDEQHRPYEGKHRAPESKSRGLEHGVANMVLDQPATAPYPLPNTPGSDSAEVPGDQPAGNGGQSADGLGAWSQASPGIGTTSSPSPCATGRARHRLSVGSSDRMAHILEHDDVCGWKHDASMEHDHGSCSTDRAAARLEPSGTTRAATSTSSVSRTPGSPRADPWLPQSGVCAKGAASTSGGTATGGRRTAGPRPADEDRRGDDRRTRTGGRRPAKQYR
jgi:hypothetical protein